VPAKPSIVGIATTIAGAGVVQAIVIGVCVDVVNGGSVAGAEDDVAVGATVGIEPGGVPPPPPPPQPAAKAAPKTASAQNSPREVKFVLPDRMIETPNEARERARKLRSINPA
jgi:hypothetical protein